MSGRIPNILATAPTVAFINIETILLNYRTLSQMIESFPQEKFELPNGLVDRRKLGGLYAISLLDAQLFYSFDRFTESALESYLTGEIAGGVPIRSRLAFYGPSEEAMPMATYPLFEQLQVKDYTSGAAIEMAMIEYLVANPNITNAMILDKTRLTFNFLEPIRHRDANLHVGEGYPRYDNNLMNTVRTDTYRATALALLSLLRRTAASMKEGNAAVPTGN